MKLCAKFLARTTPHTHARARAFAFYATRDHSPFILCMCFFNVDKSHVNFLSHHFLEMREPRSKPAQWRSRERARDDHKRACFVRCTVYGVRCAVWRPAVSCLVLESDEIAVTRRHTSHARPCICAYVMARRARCLTCPCQLQLQAKSPSCLWPVENAYKVFEGARYAVAIIAKSTSTIQPVPRTGLHPRHWLDVYMCIQL